jgi:glyoxylase-like metal-dependent hydrolase (beta-lactamase superfamily II)
VQRVLDKLYTWSVFNEEKKMNFNGLYLRTATGPVLVDPPPMSEEDISQVESLGIPGKIYLTNKHHTRASQAHREAWDCRILIHEDDRPLMEISVDGTFSDGERLDDTLEVIRIPCFKTPGECAFYWKERSVLIVGDALLGKPPGSLSLLPDEKFKDPVVARQGLLVLRGLEFDHLMVGDGQSILENARPLVEKFIRDVQGS